MLSVYCCEVQLGGPSLFLALAVDQEVVVIAPEVVSYHYLVYCEYIHRISEICALRSYFVYFRVLSFFQFVCFLFSQNIVTARALSGSGLTHDGFQSR